MSSIKQFGKEIAKAQDRLNRNDELVADVRTKYLERITGEPKKKFSSRIAVSMALAAVLTLIVTGYTLYSNSEDLKVTLGNEQALLPMGQWVLAPSTSSLPLHFSDGSTVILDPGTRARVQELHPFGARLLIENGSAKVSVEKKKETNWTVDVGPFEVVVIGTEFDVEWDSKDLVFSLRLLEGNVLVSGAMIDSAKEVRAGETLSAWVEENRYEVRPSQNKLASVPMLLQDDIEASSDLTPESHKENTVEQDSDTSLHARLSNKTSNTNSNSWHSLARRGIYDEAMALAKKQGIENVIAKCSASRLLLLADTARLSDELLVAQEIYETVRMRFGGTSSAGKAAFALGRMAFDQQRSYNEAATWLKIFLIECGDTPLAREALGRLMEACELGGDIECAKTAAKKYLIAYPDGPHAILAQQFFQADGTSSFAQ